MRAAATLAALRLLGLTNGSPANPPPPPPLPPPESTSVGSEIVFFLSVVVGLSVFLFLLECGCHLFRIFRDGKSIDGQAFADRLNDSSNVVTRGPGQRPESVRRSSRVSQRTVDDASCGNVKI